MLAHRGDRFVESAAARMILALLPEVPFAEEGGRVSGLLHRLSEGRDIQRQLLDVVHRPQRTRLPIEAVDTADRVNAGAWSVLAADECGAGRLAVWAAGVGARKS